MALVDINLFERVFANFIGKKIGFIALRGNVGDILAEKSSLQLFRHFGIDFCELDEVDFTSGKADWNFDEIAISAQGTMGSDFYAGAYSTRQEIIKTGLPITILPSSFIDTREDLTPYRKIFVRERESQLLHPDCELVPDTAMTFCGKMPDMGFEFGIGVFLRTDREKIQAEHPMSLGDPVKLCARVNEYFELASKFETVVTDRLHFCIAALLLYRKVIFLPNSYHKNRSFFETWLTDLCSWQEDLEGIRYDKTRVENDLYRYLAGPPSKMLPWDRKPLRENGFLLERFSDGMRLINADGIRVGKSNEISQLIWQLCDGSMSIDEMVELLAKSYSVARSQIAHDVQAALSGFHDKGAVTLLDKSLPESTEVKSDGAYMNTKNSGSLHLEVGEPRVENEIWTCSATLHGVGEEREIWFSGEAGQFAPRMPIADPFILVFLMYAMAQGRPLQVTGAPISSGFLYNLWEFQKVWSMWRKLLTPIDISGTEIELTPVNSNTVATFSGGVDSCYTVYNSLAGDDRNYQPDISAGVMLQGFDIPLNRQEIFSNALEKNRRLLDDFGIPLISLATNARKYTENWVEEHGLILGALLTMLSDHFGRGIVAATNPYAMSLPVGSHFVTDRLMGSDRFSIEHLGAGATRLDKIRTLTGWALIDENLRICWSGKQLDRNCRQCRKCVLAAMMFDLLGDVPECLSGALSKKIVKNAIGRKEPGRLDLYDMRCLVEEANRLDIEKPWLPLLRKVIRKRS